MDTTDSFGYWVRRRRKALDLTQEDLAQRVGCAAVTLRKIEADERRPSFQMARRLAHCLALPDGECAGFIAAAVGERSTTRLTWSNGTIPRQTLGNLPAPITSLVGRSAEIASVIDCLNTPGVRLLTLTGPVGVGKTCLALEVGRRMADTFRDGVILVSLGPVQDPTLVSSVTATVLGVREARDSDVAQSVADSLASKDLLLIFDNFEHLLPAATFLSRLLGTCPSLRVLVTSRSRLHLYGEHEVTVEPLSLPDLGDPESAADAPAVRLFCARAQAVRADFRLTPSLTPVVAEMCHKLDGLPLAIELAAARLKLFSPQELQQRLERPFPLLTQNAADLPPRMQGLENAIAWSYGVLSPSQRALLARLAVFVGGFTLPAVEAVCAFPVVEQAFSSATTDALALPEMANGVDALLDQSLVHRDAMFSEGRSTVTQSCVSCPRRLLCTAAQCETRFAMLGTIREFAVEQLRANGELEVMQRRHAGYFVIWAEEAGAHLQGPDQAMWLERLKAEAGNLRAALAWLLAAGEVELAAGLACALGEFWNRHSHTSEGLRWLQQVLAQMTLMPLVPDSLRARTLQVAAVLAYRQGDQQSARQWLAESLALFRAAADRSGLARVLFDLGWIALDQADWAEALRLNQDSLALAREADDPCAAYRALTNLGWAQLYCGERDAAAAYFHEAYELAERSGHTRGVAVSLANLAWIALYCKDLARSTSLVKESLRLCHLLGEREVLAECLEILAIAAFNDGNARRAVQLRSGAETLWEALQVVRPPTHLSTVIPIQAAEGMHGQLTEAAFQSAWRQGQAMRLDTMVAFALGCGDTSVRILVE